MTNKQWLNTLNNSEIIAWLFSEEFAKVKEEYDNDISLWLDLIRYE